VNFLLKTSSIEGKADNKTSAGGSVQMSPPLPLIGAIGYVDLQQFSPLTACQKQPTSEAARPTINSTAPVSQTLEDFDQPDAKEYGSLGAKERGACESVLYAS
jgi:hypothetical protein